MCNALRAVVWGAVLAAGLASGQERMDSATVVKVRREQPAAPDSSCYAEYWYGHDPFRRIRLLGTSVASQELSATAALKGRSCPRGYVCQCGDVPMAIGGKSRTKCAWPCFCVSGGRWVAAPQDSRESLSSRGPLNVKLGADAIVTLRSPGNASQDAPPLTLSGPGEIPLDETAIDLSTLEVRCKAKAAPRSGRRPR
jgi:hypothetical protein